MVSRSELLINVVMVSKPKALLGLSQKGKQSDVPLNTRGTRTMRLPANRQNLTCSCPLRGTRKAQLSAHASVFAAMAGDSQGKLLGKWV